MVTDETQELTKDGMEIEEGNDTVETVTPVVDAIRDEQEVTTSAVAETTVAATVVNESSETMGDSSEITMDTSVIEETERNSEVGTGKDARTTVEEKMEETGQKSISFNYKGKTGFPLFPHHCPLSSRLPFTIRYRHVPLIC